MTMMLQEYKTATSRVRPSQLAVVRHSYSTWRLKEQFLFFTLVENERSDRHENLTLVVALDAEWALPNTGARFRAEQAEVFAAPVIAAATSVPGGVCFCLSADELFVLAQPRILMEQDADIRISEN